MRTICEQGVALSYRFRQRVLPTTNQKSHHLTDILYLIPLIAITVIVSLTLATSNHFLSFNSVASSRLNVAISSPKPHAIETSTFQVIGKLAGRPTSAYDMFWYVDNGQWNWMAPSADGTTKRADISVSNWHWHAHDNDYFIDVVAIVHDNGERFYAAVPIRVGAISGQKPPSPAMSTPSVDATMSQAKFYVDPASNAAQTAASTGDPTMKRVMSRLATMPTATWLGNWDANVESDVANIVKQASAAHQVPVFVTYNIPDRDCSGYSGGGTSSPAAYKTWIQAVAAGIGHGQAIVIVEPDALAQISCLSSGDAATRNQLLSFAVTTLNQNAGTKVYLDAGNPSWIPANVMAADLRAAGITQADGFSLNISNFIATKDNVAYGTTLSKLVGGKHFVIDTSRNGNGSSGEWCNPAGRALGAQPTANTGNPLVDDLLWIKVPGESDGTCNGGPAAGVWWPTYAEGLALNAGW